MLFRRRNVVFFTTVDNRFNSLPCREWRSCNNDKKPRKGTRRRSPQKGRASQQRPNRLMVGFLLYVTYRKRVRIRPQLHAHKRVLFFFLLLFFIFFSLLPSFLSLFFPLDCNARHDPLFTFHIYKLRYRCRSCSLILRARAPVDSIAPTKTESSE